MPIAVTDSVAGSRVRWPTSADDPPLATVADEAEWFVQPNRLPFSTSSNGTFAYAHGTNPTGDPIGGIDTHQLGTGLGGHVLFTLTENRPEPALINTGTWTPNLPSLQYYKIKLQLPGLGAQATNVVCTINPGGEVSPWKIRVNQAWNSLLPGFGRGQLSDRCCRGRQ